MSTKNMTTLTKRELEAARKAEVRTGQQTRQRRFFDEIVQDCGVCWDKAEHDRGFCQTDEGQQYREIYTRQRQELEKPRASNGMTDKQLNFIRKLVAERDVIKAGYTFEDWAEAINLKEFTKAEASKLIDSLLEKPKADKPKPKQDDRPASGLDLTALPDGTGYYAVPDGDTRLKLKIDVVTDGKWAGWVFVKDAAVYGEGKRYGMQRPGQTYQGDVKEALEAVLRAPDEARAEYGRLTGRCGRCNRPLEDETSVKLGIGPVCRNM